MKKVLFVATVVKTHINSFHLPYMKWFQDNGYEVSVAAKNDFSPKSDCHIPHCDVFYDLNFERFPISKNNYNVYRQLKQIVKDNNFQVIHCHTPVGGVIGRLAAKKNQSSKVVYTAHGYHFWKGAPLLNWLLYYPIEKALSSLTDDVILINKDDYNLALRHKMARNVHYIPGIGINFKKFSNPEDNALSILDEEKFNLTFVGELTKNKNQALLIKVVHELKDEYPNLMLNIVGGGSEKDALKNLINTLGVENNVSMLGFRKDIPQILKQSDLVLSASLREGLPVNIMESMASGKPIIASDCRGNRDLIIDGYNGFIVDFTIEDFTEKVKLLINDKKLRNLFSKRNSDIAKDFDLSNILPQYVEIYTSDTSHKE